METKIGFTPYEAMPKNTSSNPFRKFNWKKTINNVFKRLTKLCFFFAKLVVSATIWMAFFHFVPELEEYIPSLKTFCEWILSIAEYLFAFIVNLLQKFT